MKQRVLKIIVGLIVGLGAIACSKQKVSLSSSDPELIYEQALKFYEEESWNKASRYFENVIQYFIGTPRADTIAFYNCRAKFKSTDYYSAISAIDSYRMQYSRSPFLEDAEGMLTLSYYYTSPGPERDPANIYQTLSSIAEFQSHYPDSEQSYKFEEMKLELIQRLHDRSYLSAYTYYKIGRYKAAIVAFKNSLKEYPETTNREKIMYYMISAAYELAKNSIPSLQVDRYMAMIDMYYTFISEFPDSEFRKSADDMNDNAKAFLEKSNPTLLEDEGETIL